MPMFEYQCKKCNHQFEELIRKPQEEQELVCPSCGADNPVKLLSGFATSTGALPSAPSTSSASHSCGSGGFS